MNQDLLLPNEYLIAENRILRGHLPTRPRLADRGCLFEGAVADGVARQRLSIVVNLRAASLHETVKPSSSGFHLTSVAALYFDSNAHEGAKPEVAPYVRARCAQAQKDEQATAYLLQAVG